MTDDQPRANCRDASPELFFPPQNAGPQRIKTAKDVCTDCPLLDPCLAFALGHKVEGIWAGTTPPERNDIRGRHGIRAKALSFGGLVKRGNGPGVHPGGTTAGVEIHRNRYEPLCEACATFEGGVAS